jgi:ketosteroid isomerase-like protein
MSQENLELAGRAYAAMNSGDLEALLALMHPEVEAIPRLVGVEGGESYRGHEGVREWWQSIRTAFPDFNLTVLETRAATDSTIGNLRFQGHGAGSGVPFEDTIWLVARWRDGKATWIKSYRNRGDALEAAGLRE